MSLTQIIGKLFIPRQKALEKHQNGGEALQRAVLEHLIHSAKNTEYGRNHAFVNIKGYDDFIDQVPVNTYGNRYLYLTHQSCHAHIVHRLDRDTSGLMVVSKSKQVSQRFEADWKGIVYDRAYVAVAWGKVDPPKGTIRSWLTDGEYCVLSSPTDNGGKLAVTHYNVVQTSRRYSLLELRLDTGRRNQIRVHLREEKHPVVHDPMYGYKDDISPINRLALHAFRLGFYHPVTGKRLAFETPYPSAFLKLMEL